MFVCCLIGSKHILKNGIGFGNLFQGLCFLCFFRR
jgi:hypothetical protein